MEEKKLLNKVVYLCTKSILVALYNYGWTPYVTWTILTSWTLLPFWVLVMVVPLLSMEDQRAL